MAVIARGAGFDRARGLLRGFAGTLPRAEWRRIGLYVALSLAGALAGGAAAFALVPLVQPGALPRLGGHALALPGGIAMRVAGFVAASGAFALSRWWSARLAARLAGGYAAALRRRAHARLLEAPLPALAAAGSAQIANGLTYNVEVVTQGYSALLQLLVAAITAAVSLALAFLVSPALLLALPLVLGFALLALRARGREQAQVSRRYVADMTRLFRLSEDFPRRLRHIRSFGRQAAERDGYAAICARLGEGYRRQQDLVASGRLALELAAVAVVAGVLVLAGLRQGEDRAALITVSLLLGRLLPYLVSTRQSLQQLRAAAPALALWRRHAQLPAVPQVAPAAALAGELRIELLRLAPPLAHHAIGALVLAPGRMTLVLGASGVGKSSLLDVLAGMAEPAAFQARQAGTRLDFAGYRARVGHGAYLAQGVRPWQRTVRECLAWAAPDADPARLWAALEAVGLAARVAASAQRLDTPLDDGEQRFSGGEQQRLLIAQVILREPVLALLDEATSALDAASEQAVLLALKRCLPRTALVVVSHRPRLAAIADRCLSLDAPQAAAAAEPSR